MVAQVEAFPSLRAEDCPIQVGFRHRKHRFEPFSFIVTEVGKYVRVTGGWVVPVRMRRLRSMRSALLRFYSSGTKSGGRVERVVSKMWTCYINLKDSAELPQVVEDADPGVLCVLVVDDEGYAYHIRLRGICGPVGTDECIALGDGNFDEE